MKKSVKTKSKTNEKAETPIKVESLHEILSRIANALEIISQNGPVTIPKRQPKEEDIPTFEVEKIVKLADGSTKKVKFISDTPERNAKPTEAKPRTQKPPKSSKEFAFHDSLPKGFRKPE